MKQLKLKGCREHNLKGFDLSIPKECYVVITGVSGSGKSSLAYDTLYTEGQRRYLEYLSPDVRKQVKLLRRPQVDSIEGLSPTLATGHSAAAHGNSTIATHTDIQDFLALLFAKLGVQHSPVTGKKLERLSKVEMVERILTTYPEKTRLQLIAPISLVEETLEEAFRRLLALGFVRILVDGVEREEPPQEGKKLEVVVDRIQISGEIRSRLAGSVETALELSRGILKVREGKEGSIAYLTEIFVCPESGLRFPPLEAIDFNPRSKRGACPACSGLGKKRVADFMLHDWDDALPFNSQLTPLLKHLPVGTRKATEDILEAALTALELKEKVTFGELTEEKRAALFNGLDSPLTLPGSHTSLHWRGLNTLFSEAASDKFPYCCFEPCSLCHGKRLKPESLHCLIDGQSIASLLEMDIQTLLSVLPQLSFQKQEVAEEILPEIIQRVQFLEDVGLGYLSLTRTFSTLSDGEAQRIELAALLGAHLGGVVYILDEPTRGLHPLDMQKLLQVILRFKREGSSVIVVEHERTLIEKADYLIEMGPGAGDFGGEVLFTGTPAALRKETTPTAAWLKNKKQFPKSSRGKPTQFLEVNRASCHNLNDFSVKIPLQRLCVVTGVSGSGKSTLLFDVVANNWSELAGGEQIERLQVIPQKKSRISLRSVVATYAGVMDSIRKLFAEAKLAKARGYGVSRFSLNTRGGRCEACQGLGVIKETMQFIADLHLPCELCGGTRFNHETLQVTWNGLSIAEVLNLSVSAAHDFFSAIPSIEKTLALLKDLGLDYLTLGQSLATLSGGEMQRLRLSCDLAQPSSEGVLYLLDEPSTGLHYEDIDKLLRILSALVERGNSVLIIEHRKEVIAAADWAIELGPVGGPEGGKLLFSGTPEELKKEKTPTALALQQ